MKITIITVCFNAINTIEDTILSVAYQRNAKIEHIIIDGKSTDGTLNVITKYENMLAHVISEADSGIYDAMNKGIRLATGDVVGILNADDIYADQHVLRRVAKAFDTSGADAVFGDLVYVRPDNLGQIVRYYRSNQFSVDKFARGWMPAHPTFFIRKTCYDEFGLFKTDYKIASDFELLVRFMAKHNLCCYYIPEILVKMRTGGISTKSFKSNWILNCEIIRACRNNGIKTNMLKVLSKYITKSLQLIQRPQ
jgi:glycosyltransferase involved in cell wall biosynthesis